MHIVLSNDAKPVHAHVRKVKPILEQSLHDQHNSWMLNGVNAPAITHGAVLLSQCPRKTAALDGL